MAAVRTRKESVYSEISAADVSDINLQERTGEPILVYKAPDGGWGWMIVLAAMIVSMIVDGISFSFGVYLVEFVDYFGESTQKTAWVGSLIPGMYSMSGTSYVSNRNITVCRGGQAKTYLMVMSSC